MDYAQRIKNLEEQIALNSQVSVCSKNKTFYEQIKAQYGVTQLVGSKKDVINCIYCKQPPYFSAGPTNSNNDPKFWYIKSLSCACEKEGIQYYSISRHFKYVQKLKFVITSHVSDRNEDTCLRLCVENWNNNMMGMLTGIITPSEVCASLSNGLFGEPFKP